MAENNNPSTGGVWKPYEELFVFVKGEPEPQIHLTDAFRDVVGRIDVDTGKDMAKMAFEIAQEAKGIADAMHRDFSPRVDELRTWVEKQLAEKANHEEFLLSQQKQDYNIESLKQGMDAGFTGTSVIFAFAPRSWDSGRAGTGKPTPRVR